MSKSGYKLSKKFIQTSSTEYRNEERGVPNAEKQAHKKEEIP
jgi:hypothetical protein